jgi:hypothetical protein
VLKSTRAGDVAVIYTMGTVQSYVAIARVCCDARLGADDRHWSWLDIPPLRRPTTQAAVADIPGTQRPATGRDKPAKGRGNYIRGLARRLLRALVRDDPTAARLLGLWRTRGRHGPWPEDLDCDELEDASYEAPEQKTGRELVLSAALERTLIDKVLARRLEARDRLYRRSREVFIRLDDGRWKRIVSLGARRADAAIDRDEARRPTRGVTQSARAALGLCTGRRT